MMDDLCTIFILPFWQNPTTVSPYRSKHALSMKITDEALEELIAIYKEAPTAESRAREGCPTLMHFHGVCCRCWATAI
jgi:hypothetical protein